MWEISEFQFESVIFTFAPKFHATEQTPVMDTYFSICLWNVYIIGHMILHKMVSHVG